MIFEARSHAAREPARDSVRLRRRSGGVQHAHGADEVHLVLLDVGLAFFSEMTGTRFPMERLNA